ncbi:response regulator transcription factor [Limnohabitans sp. yimb22184]|uniref:response regulator transcription factor n=1 Tax=Limnohabitans sp. YIMB22184 TaxID=3374104 RepID=UPI003A87E559
MNQPPTSLEINALDPELAERCARGRVVVIDDDLGILEAFRNLIELDGYACETYSSARAYLQVLEFNRPLHPGPVCVLCDVKMPDMDGLQLQARLVQQGHVPLVLMSGGSGAKEAVTGFRAGALDFLIKPIEAEQLMSTLHKAMSMNRQQLAQSHRQQQVNALLSALSERELSVARMVARGMTNLGISLELNITLRTVKFHRQRAMEKLGIAGTPELVRLLQETDQSR